MADVYVIVNEETPAIQVTVNEPTESGPTVIVEGSTVGGGTTEFYNDSFVADGNTTQFTLTYPPIYMIYVDVNGLIQLEDSYSVSLNVVTLDYTPEDGDTINIEYSK